MGTESFGLCACNRNLSALCTKIEGLLCADSCMRDMMISLVCFENGLPRSSRYDYEPDGLASLCFGDWCVLESTW